METENPTPESPPSGARSDRPISTTRVTFGLTMILSALAALLFVPAGRLDWLEAWALLAAYGLFLAAYAIWGLRKDPDQLRERSQARKAENVKPWDRAIMAAYTVFLVLTPVVAGLDAGRFRWSAAPLGAKLAGWLGLVVAGALIFRTVTANTYLSRMARIQDDRGQIAVTTGPYRFVRHPMYLGVILLFLAMPLALGS